MARNEENAMWIETSGEGERVKVVIYQRDISSGSSKEVAHVWFTIAQAKNFARDLASEIDQAELNRHTLRKGELKRARADLVSAQKRVDELSKVVESLESADEN